MKEKQIFISHASENQEFAVKLYDTLLSAGYWVWMDASLEAAKEWQPQIDGNLRKSKIFLVLFSSDSIKKDWVKHEGSMAFALNQLIVPVNIERPRTYSSKELPIWAKSLQLFNLCDGSPEYEDRLQEQCSVYLS